MRVVLQLPSLDHQDPFATRRLPSIGPPLPSALPSCLQPLADADLFIRRIRPALNYPRVGLQRANDALTKHRQSMQLADYSAPARPIARAIDSSPRVFPPIIFSSPVPPDVPWPCLSRFPFLIPVAFSRALPAAARLRFYPLYPDFVSLPSFSVFGDSFRQAYACVPSLAKQSLPFRPNSAPAAALRRNTPSSSRPPELPGPLTCLASSRHGNQPQDQPKHL